MEEKGDSGPSEPNNSPMRIPEQHVVSFGQLLSLGFSRQEITSMFSSLRLFPTPFKGIYYAPSDDERAGIFIKMSAVVLYQSVELFLGTTDFSLKVEMPNGIIEGSNADPSNAIVHVANAKLSRKIKISERAQRDMKKGSVRSQKIAALLSQYAKEIIFHKVRKQNGDGYGGPNSLRNGLVQFGPGAGGMQRGFEIWR